MPRKFPVSMIPVRVQQQAHARAAIPDLEKLVSSARKTLERLEALRARDASLAVSSNYMLAASSASALVAHLLNLYWEMARVASEKEEGV